jgi:hypothetical protein
MAQKVFNRPASKSVIGVPHATGPDCRGADADGNWPMKNIGSGMPTEVRDKVPTRPWTPDRDSTQRGLKGRGLNECNMLESSREYLNQGPQLEGDVDETGGFGGQDLRGIGGRGRD